MYVAMFDPTATAILAATYLGGALDDVASALAVRPGDSKRVYVGGATFSDDFPLKNPLVGAWRGKRRGKRDRSN